MLTALAMASTWVLIYANDGQIASPSEIRRHEMGHVLCPDWKHPKGMNPATGKAWEPPARCLARKLRVEVIEVPVSTQEARERCAGAFGLKIERLMIGCSFPIEE